MIRDALVGRRFVAARRRGKLLMLDTNRHGPVLGVRFGMTGRLLVDGHVSQERLIYASDRAELAWDRFTATFAGGGALVVRDPRRLGGVTLDPDEARLGPDAATLGLAHLRRVVASSRSPVKAVLMDQEKVAGLGNLLVDEVLFRAGIDPLRVARDLDDGEVRVLHRAIRATVRVLGRRGGSHTGDLIRAAGGMCPRCGAPLLRRRVGGRTTWSCPAHQR